MGKRSAALTAFHADERKSAKNPAGRRHRTSRLTSLLCVIALLLPAAGAHPEEGEAPEDGLPVRVETVGEASGTATRHFVGRLADGWPVPLAVIRSTGVACSTSHHRRWWEPGFGDWPLGALYCY